MAYIPCPHPGCDLAPRARDFDTHMREHKAREPITAAEMADIVRDLGTSYKGQVTVEVQGEEVVHGQQYSCLTKLGGA